MNPRWDGRAGELTLDINEDNKGEKFEEEFLKKRGLEENNTFYIGDSEDDEPIVYLLPKEHFIVPFFASGEFKGKISNRAFVPNNKGDFEKYLLKG